MRKIADIHIFNFLLKFLLSLYKVNVILLILFELILFNNSPYNNSLTDTSNILLSFNRTYESSFPLTYRCSAYWH